MKQAKVIEENLTDAQIKKTGDDKGTTDSKNAEEKCKEPLHNTETIKSPSVASEPTPIELIYVNSLLNPSNFI